MRPTGPQPVLNPYSPPQTGNPFGEAFLLPQDLGYLRAAALARVQGPGMLLLLYGGFLCLVAVGMIPLAFFVAREGNESDRIAVYVSCGVVAGLLLILGPLTLLGGARMRSLKSYGLVITVVGLTFVIGFLTCIPLVAIGIWPLIVLLDQQVRRAFYLPPPPAG